MKILNILLLIFLSACGKAPQIDSELRPYLDNFFYYAKVYDVELNDWDFDILFASSMENIRGYCNSNGIRINKEFWNSANYLDKEQLFFHEAGHCFLGLSHIGTPSIMHPSLIGYFYYANNRDMLIKELFTLPPQHIYITPGS